LRRKNKNDTDYAPVMTLEEAAECLGFGLNDFKERIRIIPDFPKIKTGKDDRIPRDPAIKWLSENWERLNELAYLKSKAR
jgi:hypothetical protein